MKKNPPARAVGVTLGLLVVGVVAGGGPASLALAWLVLPAVMAAARFRAQVVLAGVGVTVAIILVATLSVDARATLAQPVTLALLVAVVSIVAALQGAEL